MLGQRRRSSPGRSSRRAVLRLESLEDRCVPANLYVTSSVDNASLAGTLRYELAHANAGDSIVIEVSSIVLTQGELVVNTWNLSIHPLVTVQNPNARATISGGNHFRVFEFYPASGAPEIDNLDITGGNGVAGNSVPMGESFYNGQGGAILNWASLNIMNCTFTHNSAEMGGAIFNSGAGHNLTIGGSTLSGNSAQDGGGIYNYFSDAELSYCTLKGNSAAGDGGALYNRGVSFPGWGWGDTPLGTLEVVGGTFYSNVAGGGGGAICNWVSTLKVSGGDFEHNKAQNGGALFNVFGTASIDGASLLANHAQPTAPGNGGGGAIENFGRTFWVSNCEIKDNGAVAGGGIDNGGGMVTVINSTLDSNWASTAGDNVYNGKWMTIRGCHLIDPSNSSYSVVNDFQGWLHVGGSTFQGLWKIKGPWINDGNNHGV
jgi:hypothetical protein